MEKKTNIRGVSSSLALNAREREILRLVVESFVNTAGPIGSRFLARNYSLGLSAASIRNTMSDLEELGYLDHPYTSAGRIPTELGYRTFVDRLMESPQLTGAEKQVLKAELDRLLGDTEELLREGSRLLGRVSNLLGVVLTPRLCTGVLERIDVVPLSTSRVMFILSVRGGLVRTIVMGVESSLSRLELDRVVSALNERLGGLTLEEIRNTCHARIRDLDDGTMGLVRLVSAEASALFSEPSEGRVRFGGAQNIMSQPEFQEPGDLRNLLTMLENEDFVVHLLEEQREEPAAEIGRASVTIGSENSNEKVEKFSIVTAKYQIGDTVGTVGVIGPTRMDYRRIVALVEGMAEVLGRGSADSES